jgi:hypothetical protein
LGEPGEAKPTDPALGGVAIPDSVSAAIAKHAARYRPEAGSLPRAACLADPHFGRLLLGV